MDGFQSSWFRMWLARSVVVSEMIPHSLGQGAPPNIARRGINTRSL